MSLDYTCYALAKRPLSPRTIAAASPDWLIAFVDADSGRPLHRARALPPYCLVWGTPRSSRLDLAALVRAADGGRLAELERRGSVGSCELEVETGFEANPEFLAELPPRPRRVLAAAGSRYDTRTSASRGGKLSWPLQAAVCRAVARAVGGLLEEPQRGTFRVVSARS